LIVITRFFFSVFHRILRRLWNRFKCPCRDNSDSSALLLSNRLIAARRIYECTFRIYFGRAICSNGERASEWSCFICKIREELQLCGGTLSFVIRGGDRLSAVVRFGSNMSYVRGEPAAPVDYPELLVGRLGGCINVRRSRRRKRKRNTKKSNNNFDNEAM